MIQTLHAFIDPWSLFCVCVITVLSWLFYRTVHSFSERLLATSSMVQSLSIIISLISAVNWVSPLQSFDVLHLSGPRLSFILLTIIYGVFMSIIIKVYVRIVTLDDQYAIFR
ncbi:MAG: hypothetical protein HPY50_13625 [Firmicutes bacterium]|nr:hypothetical protein [Bacillota bacterium]